jgi:hypothetical protein
LVTAPLKIEVPQAFMSTKSRHPVNFKGSRLARWILKMRGWRVHFDGFPSGQGMAIVYPHTSNWDFPIGILANGRWGFQFTGPYPSLEPRAADATGPFRFQDHFLKTFNDPTHHEQQL